MKTTIFTLLLAASTLAVAQEAEKYDYPFQAPKRGQTVIVQPAPLPPAPAPTPVIIVNDNHIPVPYPVYIGKRTAQEEEPKVVAPPAPTASAPAKTAEQQLEASSFVNWLNSVRMIFNTPDGVKLGNSAEMQLVIDPTGADAEVKKKLAADGVDDQGFKVTHIVVAKVLAPDFEVTEFVEKGRQAVDPNRITEWRWTITPKKMGTHKVNVSVSAVVEVGPDRAERLVKIFDREVMIIVNTVDAIKYFLLSYWQWMWSAIILPIGLWFWKHRKKKEDEEEDTDLPSAPTSSDDGDDQMEKDDK